MAFRKSEDVGSRSCRQGAKTWEHRVVMFYERFEGQANLEKRRDDVAQWMGPAVVEIPRGRGIAIGVGPAGFIAVWPPFIEIGFGHGEVVFAENVSHRMKLGHIEGPAGFQEFDDLAGPCIEIRKPTDGAQAGVDNVEALIEGCGRFIDIADFKRGSDVRSLRDFSGGANGRFTEVDTSDDGAPSGPRKGVESEVALKMEEGLAVDRADFVRFKFAESALAVQEAGDVVEVARDVNVDTVVPHGTIGVKVFFVHHGAKPTLRSMAKRRLTVLQKKVGARSVFQPQAAWRCERHEDRGSWRREGEV